MAWKLRLNRHSTGQPGGDVLIKAVRGLTQYLQEDFQADVQYVLLNVVTPILIAFVLVYGSLGLLRDVYKWMVPPDAKEIHKSGLAALHPDKRFKRDNLHYYKQAEKFFLKAIATDESYLPSYLSVATLYIYKLNEPKKALDILAQAKLVGPAKELEPLLQDAKALLAGGNQHMIQAGGGLIACQEYLTEPYIYG